MRKLHKLLMAALVITLPLAACDEGDDTITPPPPTPAVGTVSGTVTVQGEGGISGITVQLAGASAASTTTGSDGSYSFANVVEGNYSVAISGIPADFTFQNTTQSVTINQDGQTATASFSGQVVRTASISGSVTAGGVAVPGAGITISGPEGDQTKQTGASGSYQFTGLRSGDYTVTITNPDPATYTFTVSQASVSLSVGESEVVEFSGTTVLPDPDPAEISINAITKGGAPIDLTDVSGQIEVAVNVRRNGNTLDRIEIIIDGEVVAEQQFAELAIDGPAQQDEVEVVTLNVPTTQVRVVGDVVTPVLFNGGAEVSAIVYTVGGGEPVPSNKVPIVLNNPDYVVANDLSYMPLTTPGVEGAGDNTWYKGNTQFSADFFLPFSAQQPEWIEFDVSGICSFDDEESSVPGDIATGWSVVSVYDCSGDEGSTEIENQIVAYSYGTVVEGPDGTDLAIGDFLARLGAPFTLDGENRRFLRTGEVPVTMPDELYVDNQAPTVTIDDIVAFNSDFDEYWINGDYVFLDDAPYTITDGGVGVDASTYAFSLAPASTCPATVADAVAGGLVVAGGADLPETITSDGTPEGYQVCAWGADLLGNTAKSDPSNFFGVDKVAPQVRLVGSSSAADGIISPEEVTEFEDLVIYNIAGDGEGITYAGDITASEWGLEARDTRSGFHQQQLGPAVADAPAMQRLYRYANGLTSPELCSYATGGLTDQMPTEIANNWVRVDDTADFYCSADLTIPGYYSYSGSVIDMAGNRSESIDYTWLIDSTVGATIASVSFATPLYTPGQDASFTLFGTDDLEVIAADLTLDYPVVDLVGGNTTLGAISIDMGSQTIDGRLRFDGLSPFNDDLITNAVTAGTATIPGDLFFGRFDWTCVSAGNPYPGCAGADGVLLLADSAEYDAEAGALGAAALLPSTVTAGLIDAGFNAPDNTSAENFIPAQFTATAGAPWANQDDGGTPWIETFSIAINGTAVATDMEVTHTADESIVGDDFFDSVVIVANVGGNITICGASTGFETFDTGFTRSYVYSFDLTDAPDICTTSATQLHGLGIKGAAGLITSGFYVIP